MERPLKLIVEDILFGPLLLLILLSCALFLMFRQRHENKLSFRILLGSWVFLLLGSNTLFFQAISYPLKSMTPKSEKKPAMLSWLLQPEFTVREHQHLALP